MQKLEWARNKFPFMPFKSWAHRQAKFGAQCTSWQRWATCPASHRGQPRAKRPKNAPRQNLSMHSCHKRRPSACSPHIEFLSPNRFICTYSRTLKRLLKKIIPLITPQRTTPGANQPDWGEETRLAPTGSPHKFSNNKMRKKWTCLSSNTFSIFSLAATMRAMEPMLLVIVMRVAQARSSFDTLLLFSKLFMCPKLQKKAKLHTE